MDKVPIIEIISDTKYAPFVCSLAIKTGLLLFLGTEIQRFPHFQTPLSSLYKVKEALHSEHIGASLYADPNAVN